MYRLIWRELHAIHSSSNGKKLNDNGNTYGTTKGETSKKYGPG